MAKKEIKVKIAPNSKESEMLVLGCMLTSINGLNIGADNLDDSDFYYTEHQHIFRSVKFLYKSDKPADIHIVSEELKKLSILDEIGGIAYLTTLAQYAGTSAYIEEYIKLVKEKSILRRMIQAAESIEKSALEEAQDVATLLDEAQGKLFQISQNASFGSMISLKDLLAGVKAENGLPYLKELQERQQKFLEKGPDATKITGIPTHFHDLDKLINGFSPSNLMILAARPAMGKTALAMGLAENICFKNNLPVGVFSLEMSAMQLLHRMICSQAEVSSEKILTGALSGIEYQKIVYSVNQMQKHQMIIDDQPGLKITDLRSRARRMKEAHNIAFLVIDYLQLISGSGTMRSLESRQIEVSEISRLLKTLARELDIPVLCLSQLSRKVEERQGHRPMMSDLRESGCLAADTLIKDAESGEIYPIKELAERSAQTTILVEGVNKQLKLGKHRLLKAFYSGKKIVFELKIKIGKTIKASANHPFLKLEGWTRLDRLNTGDRIAIPRKTSMKNPSFKLEDEEPIFLPHFLDDGCILPSHPTHLYPDIYWDEIVSIQEIGLEDVYDATIENVHNFVANDIIVHNSLEQDSDLVMFLLRREYYDPYDKPGLAELIIAKNRHGAIGNIDLVFRKEFAHFKNFTPSKGNKETFDNSDAFNNLGSNE